MMNTLVLILSLLLWQPAGGIGQQRITKSGDVILGGLLPLHERTSDDKCGAFFQYGLDYVEAMTYAINKINNDSSILPNITLGYDIRDFCDSPSLAMKGTYDIATNNYLRRLVDDYDPLRLNSTFSCQHKGISFLTKQLKLSYPIAAIVGPVDSSSCLVVANLLEVVHIPAISPFATSEELSSGFTSFFRTVPSDAKQAEAIADIIDHFQWRYTAVIAVDHSYGRYGIRALEREVYKRNSFCIAVTEYFPQSGYEDKIKAIIQNLKHRSNIQVIVLWSTYTSGLRVLKEAARQGLYKRTWVISEGVTMQGAEFFGDEETSVVDGFIGIVHPDFGDEAFKKHLRLKKMGLATNWNPKTLWWQEFWNLQEANISNSQKHNERAEPLSPSSLSNTHLSYTAYLIDAVYAIAHALDNMYRCTKQNSFLKGGRCPRLHPFVNPQELIQYLRKVNFAGLTGRISFDERGDPLSSSYDVINFQPKSTTQAQARYVKIGTWGEASYRRLKINESLVKWKRNGAKKIPVSVCRAPCPPGKRQTNTISCCWECVQCADGYINPRSGNPNCTKCRKLQKSNSMRTECVGLPVTNLHWGDPSGLVYMTLTSIGVIFALWVAGIFVKYHGTPVVKSANRELSFIMLLAISLCFVLTFIYLHIPTDIMCMIVQPGRYLVYTLCVSVLLVKTNRIVRLFALGSFPGWLKRIAIDSKCQLLLIAFLNGIQIGFAITWLTFDPPRQKVEVQSGNHMWYTCSYSDTTMRTLLEGSMFVYLVSLSAFCTFYAFKARKLPENYNETKHIGFAMYILVISWITFYPITSAIEGNYIVHIACTTTLVSAYGMLGCLFLPKLYIILIHPEKNTPEFVKATLANYSIKAVSKISLTGSTLSITSSANKNTFIVPEPQIQPLPP